MTDSPFLISSADGAKVDHNSRGNSFVAPTNSTGRILAERWPTLSRALSRYEQGTAEEFSRRIYDSIDGGLIRLDSRRLLAKQAAALGIRDFDAQLLIACTIRQWALDHQYDASPSPMAPELSFEYRAWGRVWRRLAIVGGMAAILDGIIIWKWLS